MIEIIEKIIQEYPESEWLERCISALPDVPVGAILSIIEIYHGGDVVAIED